MGLFDGMNKKTYHHIKEQPETKDLNVNTNGRRYFITHFTAIWKSNN